MMAIASGKSDREPALIMLCYFHARDDAPWGVLVWDAGDDVPCGVSRYKSPKMAIRELFRGIAWERGGSVFLPHERAACAVAVARCQQRHRDLRAMRAEPPTPAHAREIEDMDRWANRDLKAFDSWEFLSPAEQTDRIRQQTSPPST